MWGYNKLKTWPGTISLWYFSTGQFEMPKSVGRNTGKYVTFLILKRKATENDATMPQIFFWRKIISCCFLCLFDFLFVCLFLCSFGACPGTSSSRPGWPHKDLPASASWECIKGVHHHSWPIMVLSIIVNIFFCEPLIGEFSQSHSVLGACRPYAKACL